MSLVARDLFANTRAVIRGARVLDVLLIALLAVILVALLAGDPASFNVLTSSTLPPEQRVFAARVGVAGALVGCLLFLPLMTQLLRIVDSARQADPFIPENGARLRRIGWLILAIDVVTQITVSVAISRDVRLPPVSFTALLTVLMVFVIARIFDTGSAMRAELKETV